MKNNQQFHRIANEIVNDLGSQGNFKKASNDFGLEIQDNLTEEQKLRDEIITTLLDQYVNHYTEKNKFAEKYRDKLLNLFLVIMVLLFGAFIFVTLSFASKADKNWVDLTGIISSFTAIISLIVGALKVVGEYIYPKDDEQYITSIVSSIQQNDLAHKIENMKMLSYQNDMNENAAEAKKASTTEDPP